MLIFYCRNVKDSAVIKRLYEEATTSKGTDVSSTLSAVIDVYPNTKYTVKVEVLRSGLGDQNAKISSIVVDGTSIGECNPPGSDTSCDFYNCVSQLDSQVFTSKSGKLPVEIKYVRNSFECRCDTDSWSCSAGLSGTQMVAAARLTLNPWGKWN